MRSVLTTSHRQIANISSSWAPLAWPRPPGSRQRGLRPQRHVLLLLVQRRLRRRRLRRRGAWRTLPRGIPPPPPPPPPPAAPRLSLGAGSGEGKGGGAGTRRRADQPRSLARSLPPSQWRPRRLLPAAAAPARAPLATARAWRGDRCRGITAPGRAPREANRRCAGAKRERVRAGGDH